MQKLTFGQAIEALKLGQKVQREGWNGKGMYIFLIGENGLTAKHCRPYWTYTNGVNDNYPLQPFLAMKTADDKVLPWVTSQADVLAEDWQVVIS
ncbi:MAG: DUF2829 domain-containing protein [Bacteroidetes bacterium]|nr:DUF2829 domain-containing protein [Bacteroidota bacterium]